MIKLNSSNIKIYVEIEYGKILIVGGAGYVGTELVDMLVTKYKVTVYDLFIYGDNIINHENLTKLKGDVRNQTYYKKQ